MLAALIVAAAVAAQAPATADPFAGVVAEVKADLARHQHPLAVFDLDDTLFATAPRTRQILREWLATDEARGLADAKAKVDTVAIGYNLPMDELGIPKEKRDGLVKFWGKRFFSSAYLKYDQPNPGAVPFTKAMLDAGATVVYLTGRPQDMQPGTELALQSKGFAWSPKDGRTMVFTKKVPRQQDTIFKEGAVHELERKYGPLVFSIDNEPRNVNMFHRVAPKAITVYLDKPHSADAPPLDAGVRSAQDFPAKP